MSIDAWALFFSMAKKITRSTTVPWCRPVSLREVIWTRACKLTRQIAYAKVQVPTPRDEKPFGRRIFSTCVYVYARTCVVQSKTSQVRPAIAKDSGEAVGGFANARLGFFWLCRSQTHKLGGSKSTGQKSATWQSFRKPI